jgi:hypothetical protein
MRNAQAPERCNVQIVTVVAPRSSCGKGLRAVTVSLPLDHCRGTKGVKIVGKSSSKEISVLGTSGARLDSATGALEAIFDLLQAWIICFDPSGDLGGLLQPPGLHQGRRGESAPRQDPGDLISKSPSGTKVIDRVIHDLGLGFPDSAASHRIVKHAVHLLPSGCFLVAGHIMKDGGIPIAALKRGADHRPKNPRNGSAVNNPSRRGEPSFSLRIDVRNRLENFYHSAGLQQFNLRILAESAPRGIWDRRSCHRVGIIDEARGKDPVKCLLRDQVVVKLQDVTTLGQPLHANALSKALDRSLTSAFSTYRTCDGRSNGGAAVPRGVESL